MTSLLLLVALAAAPALELSPVPGHPNLRAAGIPEIPPALSARLEQYQNARAASLLDVTPDGATVLVKTRFGNVNQLHLVAAPLGMREQLTFGREPVLAATFLPQDPKTIFYLQDQGGGEFYQVYRHDRRTGRAELLTDGKSRHENLLVSRDGTRIAFSSTARNGKDTDVYVADAARPKVARRLFEEEGTFYPIDLSPDGKQALILQFRSIADADLWVADAATGRKRLLTEGKGSIRAAAFSADARAAYVVTDRGGDFNALYRIALQGDARAAPVAPNLRWDVDDLAVASDGSRVAFVANEDGYSRLYLLDPRTGRTQPVTLPAGVVTAIRFPDRRSDRLFLAMDTPASPTDVWQLDLKSAKTVRWTRSEVGGLDPSTFVAPELVRYPSSDGITVPAFLYRPKHAQGRVPVVVDWHGGPEGQSLPKFLPYTQFLVNELGLAVLAPNVRGSDGYGKAYLAADDGPKREASLADVRATFDFIARRPELDASRVAVYGGSYGGYMVLASVAFFPERVRAGVDVVGISSLASFLENTQAYRRDLRRAEYGDERVPEVRAVMDRISPLLHVGKIQAPLLVVQGKNDPRVPESEAEQIARAVLTNGKELWYLLALDEGHGFQKKENRDYYTAAVALFLDKQLKETGASTSSSPFTPSVAPP
jgi:dipeptidyl aminopeptidase/acylaminoacyl peptidase